MKGPRNLAGRLSSGGRWSNPQSLWAEVTAKKGNKCPSPAPQLCFHRPNDGTERWGTGKAVLWQAGSKVGLERPFWNHPSLPNSPLLPHIRGHHQEFWNRFLSVRKNYNQASALLLIPSLLQVTQQFKKTVQRSSTEKSPICPPTIRLTKKASQCPVTASRPCCPRTLPPESTKGLGTPGPPPRWMPLLGRKLPRDKRGGLGGGKACSPPHWETGRGSRSWAWERSLRRGLLNIWTSVGSDFSALPSSLHPPLPHPPQGVLTHYYHWSPEDLVTHQAHTWFQWALDHYMVGEQEKQMKAVVIRQRRSSNLPDKRDCRHVPKSVQAPDMQSYF